MSPLIETKNLVTNFYTYEGVVRALDRVSLTVHHGETFGLVGESGCGKSVTVRSMMRIIQEPGRVEGGQILFTPRSGRQGQTIDLLQQGENVMRGIRGDSISMIFQEPNAALNPIMRIGDQVAESFLFHRKQELCRKLNADWNATAGMPVNPIQLFMRAIYRQAEKKPDARFLKLLDKLPLLKYWSRPIRREAWQRSIEIIEKLGIANAEQIAKCYPHQLSGGMKQRIVIAIALACNPVLLIADEATSNLDVTIQAQILELLRDLKQKEISSILLITHDLGVVAETCDRVGVMYAGELCEVAAVKDLFRRPLHPYTRALLTAVPRLSQQEPLASIEGSVPNLVSPPPGCRFHPRCPHAMPVCAKEFPRMVPVEKDHTVACYLYTDQGR